MSEQGEPQAGQFEQQSPEIRGTAVLVTLCAALTIMAGAVWAMQRLLQHERGELGQRQPDTLPTPSPSALPLELQSFAVANGELENRAASARLRSWGWLDAGKRTAHIPIDAAMQWLVDDAAGAATSSPSTSAAASPPAAPAAGPAPSVSRSREQSHE